MITIPPRHYCRIANPVLRDTDGDLITDSFGQVRVRHADEEIRFSQDPFPLYPGEKLSSKVTPLQVLAPNKALRLRATRQFTADKGEVDALFWILNVYQRRVLSDCGWGGMDVRRSRDLRASRRS